MRGEGGGECGTREGIGSLLSERDGGSMVETILGIDVVNDYDSKGCFCNTPLVYCDDMKVFLSISL